MDKKISLSYQDRVNRSKSNNKEERLFEVRKEPMEGNKTAAFDKRVKSMARKK